MRDGGGKGEVPAGFGNIVTMASADHRIYFIAQHGISSGLMADQIDPDRQNPNIPQLVQREELPYGATTPFIQRTFGAAAELMDPTHLPEGFPKDRGLLIALAAAKDLAAVADTVADLRAREAEVRVRMDRGEIKLTHLPSTPNLQGRGEQTIGHLRAVQVGLFELAGLFYPKARANAPWIESVRKGFAPEDDFNHYLDGAVGALAEIANCRNALIHPDAQKSVTITDYDLRADGALVAPTIEVRHPETPVSRRDIVQFFDVQIGIVADIFETFLGVFCDRNVRDFGYGIFETRVVPVSDGGLRNASRLHWQSWPKEGITFPQG